MNCKIKSMKFIKIVLILRTTYCTSSPTLFFFVYAYFNIGKIVLSWKQVTFGSNVLSLTMTNLSRRDVWPSLMRADRPPQVTPTPDTLHVGGVGGTRPTWPRCVPSAQMVRRPKAPDDPTCQHQNTHQTALGTQT